MQLGLTTPCTLCPRQCGADRAATRGYCGASDRLEVAAVCVHRGEEPPLNPIVNIFFPHCNLHCIYCQNWQISGVRSAESGAWDEESIESLAGCIYVQCSALPSPMVGFVTATHYAHFIPPLLDELHRRGITPTVVYNSSGYESVETLRGLEGLVDIYLPDYKYADPALAQAYSHAHDYPEVAREALREMRRQVGSGLKTDDHGTAYRGLIVRHLVLPGAVDNSLRCLEWLADEFPFGLHLSLMAQYFPPDLPAGCGQLPPDLRRTVSAEEYNTVVAKAVELGLTDGWIQSLDANDNYRPDFHNAANPFEHSPLSSRP